MLFYHIYGEIALELFLIVFWMVSFAGMASYVQETSLLDSAVINFGSTWGSQDNLAQDTRTSENICIAIAILGALVL
jgi:hypothetical protein